MSARVVDEPPAELLKLAHQLGVAPSRLQFLAPVATEDLRVLRRRIADTLFESDRHLFAKVVAVSRLVPVALSARIAELALSPLIAARVAELLDADRAVAMVARMSGRYLADVSAAMDPARAPHVIARIPAAKVAVVAAELARRGEWVVMGGFVALVSDEALLASLSTLSGEQLLRTGYVIEDLARLGTVTEMLTDAQLDDLLAAAAEHDLWTELDQIVTNLSDDQAERLASRYASAAPATVAAVEAAVAAGRFSAAGLSVLAA